MYENNELSERELEILQLVATGASNKEIAQQLFISTNTVKVHLRNVFAKIGATSRTEAAMFAVQHGLVDGAPLGENADIVEMDHKPRYRPLAVWSLVVVVVLLGFAGLLAVTINQRLEAGSINPTIPTDLPRWEVKAAMPTARYGFTAVAYENMIYAIAGETEAGVVDTVERYNPELDSWDILNEKPLPVSDVAGAVIGGKIYVPGGRLPSGDLTDALEIYGPRENRWEQGAQLPVPVSAYALAAFEGKLYIFGGWDGEEYRDTVYEYDPSFDRWEERTPMPTARAYSGAAVAGGKIYVLGGLDETQSLSVNEAYSHELDNGIDNPWHEAPPIPEPRFAMGVTSAVESIYVIGGNSQAEGIIPSYVFNATNDTWQSIEQTVADPGSQVGTARVGRYIYILGGEMNEIPLNQNLAYPAMFVVSIPVIVK